MYLYKMLFKVCSNAKCTQKRVLAIADSLEDAVSSASVKLLRGYDKNTTVELASFEKHATDKQLVWVIPSEDLYYDPI